MDIGIISYKCLFVFGNCGYSAVDWPGMHLDSYTILNGSIDIDRSLFDIIIAQEIGWSMISEWITPEWRGMHGLDRFASVLVMDRITLIFREAISVAHHIPGRILQVRLQLYRPHDIYTVY